MSDPVVENVLQDEMGVVSLCSLLVRDEVFGIDTRKICEVVGECEMRHVPMAPKFVGGVVAYRGEVLTAVNLRVLLGLAKIPGRSCVLVLEDEERAERFGLMVDGVDGVVTVKEEMLVPNPSSLEERSKWLFDGVYKMGTGLLVQLDPQKLQPSRLAASGFFR
jgi:purine-binding chemotaxis protein CheW